MFGSEDYEVSDSMVDRNIPAQGEGVTLVLRGLALGKEESSGRYGALDVCQHAYKWIG